MTPTLCVLLCLGLCLGRSMRPQADKPSLRADKSPLVPQGSNVTLRCWGSWWAVDYRLEKRQEFTRRVIQDVKPSGGEGQFLLSSVTANEAGIYSCLYRNSSGWSEPSDPLQLVVTGPGTSKDPYLIQSPGTPQDLTSSPPSPGTTKDSHLPQSPVNLQSLTSTPPSPGTSKDLYLTQSPGNPQGLTSSPSSPGTKKDSYLPQSPADLQSLTSISPRSSSPSPESRNNLFASLGLSNLHVGILIGISTFLILLILFLLCHRCRQRQIRLRNGDKEAEAKKNPRNSDPAGTPLEETLYAVVNKDRQRKEARSEDMVAPQKEVTYAQLNLNSLKPGPRHTPASGPGQHSLYAVLR